MTGSLDRILRALDERDGHLVLREFDPDQPRDDHGRWASEGSDGGSVSATEVSSVTPKDDPPRLPWVEPPPARGTSNRRAGGFSATGKTNTAIGDLGEAAVRKMGLTSLLSPGRRQGPLDVGVGGWGFEVKTVTTRSTEYKVKMKARELKGKASYARAKGLKPATMIVVMDARARTAHVYWRPGIVNGKLNRDWNFMGKVTL